MNSLNFYRIFLFLVKIFIIFIMVDIGKSLRFISRFLILIYKEVLSCYI